MMKRIAPWVVGIGMSVASIGVASAHDGWGQSGWEQDRFDRDGFGGREERIERLADRLDRSAARLYAIARVQATPEARWGWGSRFTPRYGREGRVMALKDIARLAQAADRLNRAVEEDDACDHEISDVLEAQRAAYRAVRWFGDDVREAFEEVSAAANGLRRVYDADR